MMRKSTFKECSFCGRRINSLGYARHKAKHRDEQKMPETFEEYKKTVKAVSMYYPSLKRNKGKFNESYLRAAFDAGQNAVFCCNSMTEVT